MSEDKIKEAFQNGYSEGLLNGCARNFVPKVVPIPSIENLLKACGNRLRKLTLHSENPKHPNLIWQATPNQHTSKFKKGVRGKTPEEALFNLLIEMNKAEYFVAPQRIENDLLK